MIIWTYSIICVAGWWSCLFNLNTVDAGTFDTKAACYEQAEMVAKIYRLGPDKWKIECNSTEIAKRPE